MAYVQHKTEQIGSFSGRSIGKSTSRWEDMYGSIGKSTSRWEDMYGFIVSWEESVKMNKYFKKQVDWWVYEPRFVDGYLDQWVRGQDFPCD